MENLDVLDHAVNYNRFLLNQIEQAASLAPGSESLLDFGAGNGRFLGGMNGFTSKFAVEIDPEYQVRLLQQGAIVSGSIDPVAEKSVDLAWSFNVLEHIEDDEAALSSLVARLRPGGRLVLYVPSCPLLYSKMDALVGHIRRYRKTELLRKTVRAGAIVQSCEYVDSIGYFASLAYRFGKGSGKLTQRSVALYDRIAFPLSRKLDRALSPYIGKNLLLHAYRPHG